MTVLHAIAESSWEPTAVSYGRHPDGDMRQTLGPHLNFPHPPACARGAIAALLIIPPLVFYAIELRAGRLSQVAVGLGQTAVVLLITTIASITMPNVFLIVILRVWVCWLDYKGV